ncbi:MAG: arginine N-succinyltransferase [Oligoflexia bacterium]|nr:arginine N-succinyltransferase [Oligoflexia bacterium]
MSFLLRSIKTSDLRDVKGLAEEFNLLNLPPDERIISEKIERSKKSFAGKTTTLDESEYFFVVEDTEAKKVVGTSLIMAKHGTEDSPHTFFDVRQKEKFSKELGIGFIHQVLRIGFDSDGPSEIGGLIVDEAYRGRPEKLGKQISLIRFLYMGMYPQRFEDRILCEFVPPLSPDGRSEFWEALGRKFTGLPYQEADFLSGQNKEFIKNLFPDEDIYTCVLDAKARYVIGRVGLATMPAKHLLEAIGFKYLNQIDPFDGGPHYGANRDDITLVKKTKAYKVVDGKVGQFDALALVGQTKGEEFNGCLSYFDVKAGKLVLPDSTKQLLDLSNGDQVFLTPISEGTL